MWSPAEQIVKSAENNAAIPELVAVAAAASSNAATRCSKTATVGFDIREYKCPPTSILYKAAAWRVSRNT